MSARTQGLSCPLPVPKARRAIRYPAPGDTLETVATDPAAPEDFRDFCAAGGHAMGASTAAGGADAMRARNGG